MVWAMRLLVLIFASTFAATTLTFSPQPAVTPAAAANCTARIEIPERLSIVSLHTSYTTKVVMNPAGCLGSAYWHLIRSDNADIESFWYSSGEPTTSRVHYYSSDGSGLYQALPTGAWDLDDNPATQHASSNSMRVKWGSKASLNVKKVTSADKKRIQLSGKVQRFRATDWTAWRATAKVQRKTHGTWRTVKTVRTNSRGKFLVQVPARSSKSSWRVMVNETTVIWGAKSPTRRI